MVDAALDGFRAAGRMLWEAGLVSSHGGNISVRLPDGGLLVTRTGAMLGRLGEGDLVTVTADGASRGEPSMDTALHRAVYEASGAQAVLHAHPRHAIALSLAMDVIEPADAEGRLRLGGVPVVEAEGVAQALQWTSVLEESAQVLWLLRAFGKT